MVLWDHKDYSYFLIFFFLGIYQRAANSDKRNEKTQSPSKEEYINNSK